MCRISLNLESGEVKRAKNQISKFLNSSRFEAYVNALDIKNIIEYVYDFSDTIHPKHNVFTILMNMIIEDTGEQFFIDNVKLSNINYTLCNLVFEDDIVFRGDKITELDYKGAEFEGKVTFDCNCFTSAFGKCIFFNDIVFTDNCKWCGSFKGAIIKGNITIPGGMFSIDITNFRNLFTEKTTYTGTKDEFLALVARSDIPDHMIDQAKKVVKFTKIDWEK